MNSTTSGTQSNRMLLSLEGRALRLEEKILRSEERLLSLEEQSERLLPGMLDKITVNHIAPKLPWRAFYTLASVSRSWQRAIRNRRVYDARVRSQSTETLIVISIEGRFGPGVGLYSIRDDSCYKLPAIPVAIPEEKSRLYKYASLDGKIYALPCIDRYNFDSKPYEAYVLDLAGQRSWKQYASMHDPRSSYGCGVLNGKIYIFGGFSYSSIICDSEVYDPKLDCWSRTAPMPTGRHSHDVTAIGEELFVHGGSWSHSYGHRQQNVLLRLEVYYPAKDKWRVVEPFGGQNCDNSIVVVQGKFHLITQSGIEVFDMERNSWTHRFSTSFPTIGPAEVYCTRTRTRTSHSYCTRTRTSHGSFTEIRPIIITPPLNSCAALAVDDEALLQVKWEPLLLHGTNISGLQTSGGETLVRSKGFGRENREIVWQKTNWSLPFGVIPSMCPIEL